MSIARRRVVHFPGFEPLDAVQHRERYRRAAAQSADVWNCGFDVGPLAGQRFTVKGDGPNWHTQADISILDHDALITRLRAEPVWRQILLGFQAGARVIGEGGMAGYFRHAWRFGIFFLFPFLFLLCGLAWSGTLAVLPLALDWPNWHLTWTIPGGYIVFNHLVLPFSARFHTLHLLADWRLAVHVARLDDAQTQQWISSGAAALAEALRAEADEYLITAHSMGASLALQALGALLEREPHVLEGKRVIFATLGGAALQCALLKSADVLRQRIKRVADCREITWFEVQSLTDPVHLYRARTVEASGFPRAPQPPIVPFRFRTVLSEERYRRIKTDILRMHRQYVLGPDRRGSFDFTLMTAGPIPAADFRSYNQQVLPPLGPDGFLFNA